MTFSEISMKYTWMVALMLLFAIPSWAQDDLESMAFDDVELEGFENVWIQCKLTPLLNMVGEPVVERVARPKGGNTNFMIYVQRYWVRVLQAVINKYPIDMLNRQGYNYLVVTNFTVDSDGNVKVNSVYGGENLGYDIIIAQKMFNDYKKWRPATQNGSDCAMRFILRVDLSL